MKKFKLRIVLIAIVLVASSARVGAQDRGVEYGVEWGYACNFLSFKDFVFNSIDGYLVDARTQNSDLHSNGTAGVFIRYRFNRHLSCGVEGSWKGIGKDMRIASGSIEGDWHFNRTDFAFGGAGLGKRIKSSDKNSAYVTLGYGRRYVLGGHEAVSLKIALQGANVHPPVFDNKMRVPDDKVRKSDAFLVSLAVTVEIALF